mgnify:CR=1 FL=1
MFKFKEEAPKIEKKDSKLESEKETVKARIGFLEKLKKYGTYGIVLATLFAGRARYEKNQPYDYSLPESPELRMPDKPNLETGTYDLPEVVIYGHSDPETDMVMNFLSGKIDLPLDVKFNLIKKAEIHFWEIAEKYDLDSSATDQLKKYENITLEEYEKEYGKIDTIFGVFKDNFDIEKYDAIWKMHRKNGNPDVRFFDYNDKEARVLYKNKEHSIEEDRKSLYRAYYNPMSNTINVSWVRSLYNYSPEKMKDFILEDWIAELSHAKQFQEKPFASMQEGLVSGVRMAMNALSHGESFYSAQLREYETEGSLENEAHTIIEAELQKTIDSIINKESEKLAILEEKSNIKE